MAPGEKKEVKSQTILTFVGANNFHISTKVKTPKTRVLKNRRRIGGDQVSQSVRGVR